MRDIFRREPWRHSLICQTQLRILLQMRRTLMEGPGGYHCNTLVGFPGRGNGVLDIGQLAVLGVVGMFLFIWLRNIKHSTSADDKAQNLSGPDIQIRRKKSECIKELTISNERVAFLLRLRRRFGSPIRQRCSGSITQLFNSQNSSHDWWEEQGGGYQPPKEGNALIDLGTQESCYSVAIFLTLAFFASMNYQKRPRPSTVGIKRTVFK